MGDGAFIRKYEFDGGGDPILKAPPSPARRPPRRLLEAAGSLLRSKMLTH